MTTTDNSEKPVPIEQLPLVRGRWLGSCFGCGEGNPNGLKLHFHHTPDGVVASCTIPVQYTGFEGLVHGGIISALMDEAAAWALFSRHGKLGITRELTTRFLKPVRVGVELRVQAKIVSFVPPDAEVTMTICDTDGMCLSEGRSTWLLPRLARMVSLGGIPEETIQRFLDDCQRVD